MNANLYAHFAFKRKPNNTLFHLDNGTSLDYQTIDSLVAQYCRLFTSLGLKQGDRVMQQTEKCVDAFCIYLASLRYGTIYIPLNPAYQTQELAYFIRDAEPALFICAPKRVNEIQQLAKQNCITSIVESLAEDRSGSLQIKAKSFAKDFGVTQQSKDDIACILYTSGTTGQPKGAMLSHENLLANGKILTTWWGFSEKDILLHTLPIFHCHGLFFACNCTLISGSRMIFLPKFDLDLAINHLPRSTVFMGVPTYYTRLLANSRFTKEFAANIRLFISGSAPLLEKTFYEFAEKIGQRLLERYGMTETGINASNPLDGERIPGSVGLPLPTEILRIVDDQDKELSQNIAGHIQVKGTNVFSGYWRKQDKTQASFTKDGFFRSGDIGIKDNNGYIYVIGRAKDMVITGGMNVYPSEIEFLINNINEIKESAIIGLPHDDFGEAVTAVVVRNKHSKLQADHIISAVKKKLANYKVPKKVVFIDELPRNAMGKVQKNSLRNTFANLYTKKSV